MPLRVHSIRMGMSVAHLVEAEQGLLLVDAGMPGMERTVLSRMRKVGRDDLKLIFITHAHLDHYGSAAALRRLTGAAIAIHSADAEALARGASPVRSARGVGRVVLRLAGPVETWPRAETAPADLVLADGDELDLIETSASVLHTPGHTDGSSCLIVDGRLAFVGDLLSGQFRPQLQRAFAVDWSLLPASLRRLQGANPQWVYTGHSRRPARGEVIQRLRAPVAGGSPARP